MSIITRQFHTHQIDQLVESVGEAANTLYFVCAMKDTPFEDDNDIPEFVETDWSLRSVRKEILFGIKIDPDDISTVVNRYDWTANTVYVEYNDRVDISNSQFFVVSEEFDEYHVFKCINNNNGAVSTEKPLKSETSPTDDIYQTSDGYVWKFLYTIPAPTMEKFATTKYIPVLVDANVVSNAIAGSIDHYTINSSGSGLNNYCNGSFEAISVSGNNLIHNIKSDHFTLSDTLDYYANTSLYIDTGTGIGQLRTITDYRINGANAEITIDSPFSPVPDATSRFRISPKLSISGDGSGAEAILNIDAASNSVASVDVVFRGHDYTYATATVLTTSNTVPSIVPVISPEQGHGSAVSNELFARKISFSTKLPSDEALLMTYRRVGILKDPLFRKVTMTLAAPASYFIGETVIQTATNSNGIVSGVDGTVVELKNVYGFISNSAPVVGSTSSFSSTPVSVEINNYNQGVFENRPKYRIEMTYSGIGATGFEVGELVTQNSVSGIVSQIIAVSGATYDIFLTEMNGEFEVTEGIEDKTMTGSTSEAVGTITEFTAPALAYAGDIIFIENIPPVVRAETQLEKFNIILGL